MTKPIDRARLAEVVARFPRRNGREQRAGGGGRCRDAAHDPRDARTRRLAGQTRRTTAPSPLERISQKRPDVILLDLMMPTMDGFELAATLHASDAWKLIPIVVLTAKDLTDDDRQRLNGSVEKIIQKGAYERRKLLDDVRDIVARHAGRAAPRTPYTEPEHRDA